MSTDPLTEERWFTDEDVEKAAIRVAKAQGVKFDPSDTIRAPAFRTQARAVLSSVSAVPRERYERLDARRHDLVSANVAMAEVRNDALRRAESAEARAEAAEALSTEFQKKAHAAVVELRAAEARVRELEARVRDLLELRGGWGGSYKRERFVRALDDLEAALSPKEGER